MVLPQKSYLLTKDIAPTLQNRWGIDVQTVSDRIGALEDEFIDEFWDFAGDGDMHKVVSAEEVSDELHDMISGETRPIVCLDDVYFPWMPSQQRISVTRLTDPHNPNEEDPPLGPRPNAPPLETQLSQLKDFLGTSEIALLDVGTFTGGTILRIREYFTTQGLHPTKLYLGFAGREATRVLEAEGIETVAARQYDFDEWVEMRDLVGIDGRKADKSKMDLSTRQHLVNAYLHIPYTENLVDWASIPHDKIPGATKLCDDAFLKLQGVTRQVGVNLEKKKVCDRGQVDVYDMIKN